MKLLFVAVLIFVAGCASRVRGDCELEGHHLLVGDKYFPSGECIEMTCIKPGEIASKTCPDVQSKCPPIAGDPHKVYPHCCPTFSDQC